MHNGLQDRAFKICKIAAVHLYPDHPVAVIIGVQAEIPAEILRVMRGVSPGMMVILKCPLHGVHFFLQMPQVRLLIIGGVNLRQPGDVIGTVEPDGPVQQVFELQAENLHDLIGRAGLFQLFRRVQQNPGLIGIFRRNPGNILHPDRQGTGDQGRGYRDQIRHQVFRVIDQQGEPGINKQEIEQQDIQHRCQNPEKLMRSQQGCHQHRQQIDGNDVCVAEAGLVKPDRQQRGYRHDQDNRQEVPDVPDRPDSAFREPGRI